MTATRWLAAAALLLTSCSTAPPASEIRFTTSQAEVAGCVDLGRIDIANPEGGISLIPERETAGDSPGSGGPPPALDPRTEDSLRYFAGKKGADTVLVTAVKASAAKAVAYRCVPPS
jgi:hypothetical protein